MYLRKIKSNLRLPYKKGKRNCCQCLLKALAIMKESVKNPHSPVEENLNHDLHEAQSYIKI